VEMISVVLAAEGCWCLTSEENVMDDHPQVMAFLDAAAILRIESLLGLRFNATTNRALTCAKRSADGGLLPSGCEWGVAAGCSKDVAGTGFSRDQGLTRAAIVWPSVDLLTSTGGSIS
jgi:hypothetical protein